jgi:hypothetical protein
MTLPVAPPRTLPMRTRDGTRLDADIGAPDARGDGNAPRMAFGQQLRHLGLIARAGHRLGAGAVRLPLQHRAVPGDVAAALPRQRGDQPGDVMARGSSASCRD